MSEATWIDFEEGAECSECLEFARGCYQRALLLGWEAWSGSTLKGKAKAFGGRYAASREGLVERLERAGFEVRFETRMRRKVAVIRRAA